MASPARVQQPTRATRFAGRTVGDRVADGVAELADAVHATIAATLASTPVATLASTPVATGPQLRLVGVEPALATGESASAGAAGRRRRPRPSAASGSTSVGPLAVAEDPIADAAAEGTPVDAAHAQTWDLVRRAQAGDGEAFGQLYDRYVDFVYRFIYFRVNDHALAEDFTSETFLRALRRIRTITYQGRDIGAWFVTIARNIIFDHSKSARHRLESTTADIPDGPDHTPSTEAAVLASLQSERLMEAVNTLNPEQRECVLLRFVHGLSVSETAQFMGKKDGAIKALQHRAVRKLAEIVSPDIS